MLQHGARVIIGTQAGVIVGKPRPSGKVRVEANGVRRWIDIESLLIATKNGKENHHAR